MSLAVSVDRDGGAVRPPSVRDGDGLEYANVRPESLVDRRIRTRVVDRQRGACVRVFDLVDRRGRDRGDPPDSLSASDPSQTGTSHRAMNGGSLRPAFFATR